METFYWYKEFGIRYRELDGTTTVEDMGRVIKYFEGKGSIDGKDLAEKYVDKLST